MTFSEKLLCTIALPPQVVTYLAHTKTWSLALAANPFLTTKQWDTLWVAGDEDVRAVLVRRPLTHDQQVVAASYRCANESFYEAFVEYNALDHEALMALSGADLPSAVERTLITKYASDVEFQRAQYERYSPKAKLLVLSEATDAFSDEFLVAELSSVETWYPKEDRQKLYVSYPQIERTLWHRPLVVTQLATMKNLYFGVARAVAASRFLTDPALQMRMAGLVEDDQPCESSAQVQAAMEANPFVAPEVRQAIRANPHRGLSSFHRHRSHDVEGLRDLSQLTVPQLRSLIETGEHAAKSVYVDRREHVAVDAQLMFELAQLPIVSEHRQLAVPMFRWLRCNYDLFETSKYNATCTRLATFLGERWEPHRRAENLRRDTPMPRALRLGIGVDFATKSTPQVLKNHVDVLGGYLECELGPEPFAWEVFLTQVDMKTNDAVTPFGSIVEVAKCLSQPSAK